MIAALIATIGPEAARSTAMPPRQVGFALPLRRGLILDYAEESTSVTSLRLVQAFAAEAVRISPAATRESCR
ncbi:MAG: hypothetical protein U0235_08385 [Polyangiaceae bacterium]